MPLKAIEAIGGIIALDARLLDFGGSLVKGSSLEELALNFERYEELAERARGGIDGFLQKWG